MPYPLSRPIGLLVCVVNCYNRNPQPGFMTWYDPLGSALCCFLFYFRQSHLIGWIFREGDFEQVDNSLAV